MKLTQPLTLSMAFVLLAACKPATETPQQAATEPATTPPAEAPASLPDRYQAVNLAELDSVESVNGLCDQEEAAMRGHLEALESFTGKPTVDGFYESLNGLKTSLNNLRFPTEFISAVHPDQAVREANEACALRMVSIATAIDLSRPIFDAVSQLETATENDATQHSVEKQLLDFRLAGVDKDDATRERIRALKDEIQAIGQEFDRNIREDVRTLELDSVDDLAGLPEDYIAAHPPGEDGKIRITTQYPDLFPFVTYSESDDLRLALYKLYNNRGYPQNKEVLENLIARRFELAQLVGFDNYAQLITANKMVGNPERVEEFLSQLKEYTAEANDREYQLLLERLRQDQPDAERVERWQASFIGEKVRREQFAVDSKEVREYFSYNNTRDGMLTMVQDLFQVQIRPWETHTWSEEVSAYELMDGDLVLGRFYLDMHPREGKFGHAAMFQVANGIDGQQLPVASLVCNFPAGDELMQHSQVETFLHEFGHLIHWLFAGHHRWDNVSGIATEWDFVEAPSQMLEEWVWNYETISRFARNGDGETLPENLLERMIAARDFGLGMGTRRQLSLAAQSMALYNNDPAAIDLDELFPRLTKEHTHFEEIPGTHFYTGFGHLNDYSAIYYTYQWSLAIATDMFTRFEEQGLRNVEVAGAYRDIVLGGGGTRPANDLVTEFLGREISFKPYADRLSGNGKDRSP